MWVCVGVCVCVPAQRKKIMSTGQGEKRKLKVLKLDKKKIFKGEIFDSSCYTTHKDKEGENKED